MIYSRNKDLNKTDKNKVNRANKRQDWLHVIGWTVSQEVISSMLFFKMISVLNNNFVHCPYQSAPPEHFRQCVTE